MGGKHISLITYKGNRNVYNRTFFKDKNILYWIIIVIFKKNTLPSMSWWNYFCLYYSRWPTSHQQLHSLLLYCAYCNYYNYASVQKCFRIRNENVRKIQKITYLILYSTWILNLHFYLSAHNLNWVCIIYLNSVG